MIGYSVATVPSSNYAVKDIIRFVSRSSTRVVYYKVAQTSRNSDPKVFRASATVDEMAGDFIFLIDE